MAHVLDYVKSHGGTPPEDFRSWQVEVFPGQKEKPLESLPGRFVERLESEVEGSMIDLSPTKLVFLVGFLLFHDPEIRARLDLMLFFRLSHDVAKERRMARQGTSFGRQKAILRI